MKTSSFKKGLETVLLSVGFDRFGKIFCRRGPGVTTMLAFDKGFGDQWFINVGFWLDGLGEELPARVEEAHICIRLERLLPEYRELVLAAGALSDPEQPQAYANFLRLLAADVDSLLRSLSVEAGLRTVMGEGRFNHALVRKEARERLQK